MSNAFMNGLRGIGSNSGSRTLNGAATLSTSESAVVDFFFISAAARKMTEQQYVEMFERAYVEDKELALRMSLHTRDVRGGSGEREAFRRILRWLERNDLESLARVLTKTAEVGRWDDFLVFTTPEGKRMAYGLISNALANGNGLCAKWMPRQGPIAVELRNFLGMTPKRYRKTLVNMTKVVETAMCAKEWESINLEHVPSVASSRYRKAFIRHLPDRFTKFVEKVEKGEAKVNASAIFPHDIIRSSLNGFGASSIETRAAETQWKALPDFVGEGSFLPVVDVSGSMTVAVSGTVRAIDVAVGLGIYLSERNKSAFKNAMVTFTDDAQVMTFNETTLYQKIQNVFRMPWGMSTNLQSAFRSILDHAKKYNVPREDMPKTLLILSDMEFNACVRDLTNYDALREQYEMAGYDLPNVVFWNIHGRAKNVPVEFNRHGTGLVSGFSPAIIKSVLSSKVVTPIDIVREAVMVERYDI